MAGRAIVAKRRGPGIEPRSSGRRKLSRTVTFQFWCDCPNNTRPSAKAPRAQAAPANALQKKAATVLPDLRSPISLRPARKSEAPARGRTHTPEHLERGPRLAGSTRLPSAVGSPTRELAFGQLNI